MVDCLLVLWVSAWAALALAVGLLVLVAFPLRRRPEGSVFTGEEGGAVFLFDGEVLVDANAAARAFLAQGDGWGPPYPRLMAQLQPDFPGVESALATLAADGAVTLTPVQPEGPHLALQAQISGGLTRLVLHDQGSAAGLAGPDPMIHRALADEVAQLRRIVGQAPMPVWRERPDGQVVWANAEYLARVTARLQQGEDLPWPLPRLFDETATRQGATGQRQRLTNAADDPAAETAARAGRGPAPARDGQARRDSWFDLTSVADDPSGRVVYALPADAAVQAERALRDFMQALTQTFAHLPIGLAIFDRNRQLHMFNPALLDLTGLPAEFLALHPSLISVLDALRDSRMLPEPKDYRSWRRQLVEMEKAAAAGLYEETWSLPGGQTHRVTARPHPNGGLAMMIEDVSAETIRIRRFRAQLELGQAALDAVEEALVVVAGDGQVVMANPAYAALWRRDPLAVVGEGNFGRLCRDWRAGSSPTPLWSQVEAFFAATGDRQAWAAETRMTDGRLVVCRFVPLAGGATMAAFRPAFSRRAAAARGTATAETGAADPGDAKGTTADPDSPHGQREGGAALTSRLAIPDLAAVPRRSKAALVAQGGARASRSGQMIAGPPEQG